MGGGGGGEKEGFKYLPELWVASCYYCATKFALFLNKFEYFLESMLVPFLLEKFKYF
jgi:hypothetical protein